MHLTEDELILAYYGEAPEPDHLAGCAECTAAYARLANLLDRITETEPPRAPAGLATRVNERLGLPLPQPRWRRVAIPATIAAMLLVAFQLGRLTPVVQEPVAVSFTISPARILEAGLPDHLERSRIVLAQLANAPSVPELDISIERQLAEDLVESNRLYLQTAVRERPGMEAVLEDLDRVLLEVAHTPDTVRSADLEALRRRIEALELLFRVKVLESELRLRQE